MGGVLPKARRKGCFILKYTAPRANLRGCFLLSPFIVFYRLIDIHFPHHSASGSKPYTCTTSRSSLRAMSLQVTSGPPSESMS